ncbi:MipA family protein [Sphingomonas sp. F9_3S_D5_B_2]
MKHILIASAVLLPAWSAATAQESHEMRVRAGVGAQLRPDFIGASSTELGPLFRIDTARGDNEFKFKAPDGRFGVALVSKDGFSFGPAANIQGSRKNSDVGAPVGKVPTTFEAGAFVQYDAIKSIRFRAEVVKGIGGHKGVVGTLGADRIWRDHDRYVFSIGPRVSFSDGRYQRAYFGVTLAAALATGLPTYRPGGGVHSLGAASGLSYQFNDRWGMFGYARYERLVGDAAKSPIVREFGSRNQLSGGAGLNYTFRIRR